MTKLNKKVTRETGAVLRHRPLIIQIEPPDIIRVKEKGRRTWYVVSVENIYTLGALKMAAQVRAEKKKARKLKGLA